MVSRLVMHCVESGFIDLGSLDSKRNNYDKIGVWLGYQEWSRTAWQYCIVMRSFGNKMYHFWAELHNACILESLVRKRRHGGHLLKIGSMEHGQAVDFGFGSTTRRLTRAIKIGGAMSRNTIMNYILSSFVYSALAVVLDLSSRVLDEHIRQLILGCIWKLLVCSIDSPIVGPISSCCCKTLFPYTLGVFSYHEYNYLSSQVSSY